MTLERDKTIDLHSAGGGIHPYFYIVAVESETTLHPHPTGDGKRYTRTYTVERETPYVHTLLVIEMNTPSSPHC
jgi:hypothetical protein